MSEGATAGPLSGRRIALLETREAERLSAMLREQGAEIVACPMVAIVDAADPMPVRSWLDRFIARPPDDFLLMTGEGLTRLHALAQRSGIEAAFAAALAQPRTITRGPKPARALRMLGLQPKLRAEEPTTDGIIALLSKLDLRHRRIGVQLYPKADDRLVDFCRRAGAEPDPVTPYEYAERAADEAIAALVDRIGAGEIDAVAFTSAPQVRRLFGVAAASGRADRLKAGLDQSGIAAIGPIVADELQRHGVRATIVPADAFFMKPLVTAITAALGTPAASAVKA